MGPEHGLEQPGQPSINGGEYARSEQPEQPERQGQLHNREAWYLRAGEMQPREIQSLGHLLYAGIFAAGPSNLVTRALYEEALTSSDPSDHPDSFDVRGVPADRYVEKFAQIYGLNAGVLTRFAHVASMEFAQADLPLLIQQRDQRAQQYSWREEDYQRYEADVLATVRKIAQDGIYSTQVGEHIDLVYFAFSYVPGVGPPAIALNEDLAHDLFDSFSEREH